MAKSMTIEEGFEQLSEIMEKMEEDTVTLEESFQLYDKGMKLVRQLKTKLDATEKKLIILQEEQEK
jgi:exodeoxyribonuclease VII small subunit